MILYLDVMAFNILCMFTSHWQDSKEQPLCVVPVVTSIKEEERLIQSSTKVNTELLDLLVC